MHDPHAAPGDSAAAPPDVGTASTPFNPSPSATDAFISAIASDFTFSLAGLADEYNTTLESLTLWMTHPDIAEHLNALQSACAARVRLVASNFFPLAVETLLSVLAEFRDLHCKTICDTSSPRAMATRARAAEYARRAPSTLLRLAHYSPRRWRAPSGLAPSRDAPAGASPLATAAPAPHPPAAPSLAAMLSPAPRGTHPPLFHSAAPAQTRTPLVSPPYPRGYSPLSVHHAADAAPPRAPPPGPAPSTPSSLCGTPVPVPSTLHRPPLTPPTL